jgi:hypothetical protein
LRLNYSEDLKTRNNSSLGSLGTLCGRKTATKGSHRKGKDLSGPTEKLKQQRAWATESTASSGPALWARSEPHYLRIIAETELQVHDWRIAHHLGAAFGVPPSSALFFRILF